MVRCVCGYRWRVDDVNAPGPCPSCDQIASTAERCDNCPVVEVDHYRANTSAGHLLDRVLEHEFDCKHYHIDPRGVSAEIREGLKVLETERRSWERESREKADQEREEQQRIREMQRRSR
jgi:hypothetical protein